MVWEDLMFEDQNTDGLFEPGAFLTKYVSKVEADPVGDYTKCRKVMAELGMPDVSEEDCSVVGSSFTSLCIFPQSHNHMHISKFKPYLNCVCTRSLGALMPRLLAGRWTSSFAPAV